MSRMLYFDILGVLEADPVDLNRFQDCGSKPEVVFPVYPTCSIDQLRLLDSSPVDFQRRTHQGPLWNTTSGTLQPSTKTPDMDQPYLEQSGFIDKPRPARRQVVFNNTSRYKNG